MAPALNPGWAEALVSSTLTSSAQQVLEGSPSLAYGAGFETRLGGDTLVSSNLTPSA